MDDMMMRHVVHEEPPHPSQQWSIDCGGRATGEGPRLASVVRDLRIGMLHVRDHDNPVTEHHEWSAVVDEDVPATKGADCVDSR